MTTKQKPKSAPIPPKQNGSMMPPGLQKPTQKLLMSKKTSALKPPKK